MGTAKFSRWLIPLILLVPTLFYGCGSVDGVEGDDNIGIEIQALDIGDEEDVGTLQVDVLQQCCWQEGDKFVTGEPFTDTRGRVTFRYLGADGADNTYRFDHYTVDYIPLTSPDGRGGTFIPPDLQPSDRRIQNTIVLTRNTTEAERTIFLIPILTKIEYLNKVIRTNRPLSGFYSLKITFFGEKNRQDFTIESALEVSLGNYLNCPEGENNVLCSFIPPTE